MPDKIPSWQWTHTGAEVLLLNCVNADGSSHGGFKYPLEIGAEVTAPDWDPANRCGGGLHGWAWGIGIGGEKAPIWEGIWLVLGCAPKDVVHVTIEGDKEKTRKATIRCVTKPGDWQKATNFILAGQMAWIVHNAEGSAASSGDSSSAASSGACSPAVCAGLNSRAKAGHWGCVALAWWNLAAQRAEMRCREVGCGDGTDGKLKAGVWYRLNERGEFEEE